MNRLMVACMLLCGLFCGCRSTYMVSKVESGLVGKDSHLRSCYCVQSSRIHRSDDKGGFWDPKLAVLSFDDGAEMKTLSALYPKVFSEEKSAKRIHVEVEVSNLEWGAFKLECDGLSPHCKVMIKERSEAEVIGSETFVVALKDMTDEEVSAALGLQSCRSLYVDNPYYKTIVEGYAAAVVAALEKYENKGERKTADSTAPICLERIQR